MKDQVKHVCEGGQHKELYGLCFVGFWGFFYEKE